ncbi:TonB-dependent receptor [Sphingosinicella sp. LHD-64]|uniref:TonB-dependent receptor n=1 Tax=Sphingosinicella sp. LHD-64 TaxID=3072139 RepID=UPI0028102C35|nr:TonB-dependent receptor [Sphingosinicella sp. LHD-64]MDQ8754980.1 TonB-dependent receptor [Sphingosinicella sp. LHD-64]
MAAAILFASPAIAQERQRFNLAAGNAAQRVQTLAIQSRVQVIAPNADLAGVTTRPVNGEYTPAEALRIMLAGSGLEAAPSNGNTLVIRRASQQVALAADLPSEGQGSEAGGQESAQAQAERDREIIVTGTRIIREGVDTIRAATVTDEAEFERRAYTNVIQALSDTPGFAAPANSEVQSTQSTLGVAQSFSNFFGLGSQRTLTLVNGRRFVSSNTVSGIGGAASPGSQVDLNLLPVGLIARTETVAIGGAPIYGSDAIAGTVNVILKDDYEGLEITGQASISERGDAPSQVIRGLWGTNFMDGRGNIVLGAEYVRRESIILSDRFPALTLLASGNTDRTDGIPALIPIEQVFALMTEGGLPFVSGATPNDATLITINGADASATNLPLQFGGDGSLVPFSRGARYFNDSGGLLRNGGEGVNPADHLNLVAPNERYLLNALGNFDVTPNINIFFEGSYAHTEAVEISELFQFAAPGIGGPLLTFSIDNPFLSPEARDIIVRNLPAGQTTFRLNRNLNDIADSQPTVTELDVWRIVVGARGDFDIWGSNLNWDIAYNYGHSRNRSELNQINLNRFNAAIDVISVNGQPQCRSGGTCIPLNLFGQGAFDPEAAAAVLDQGVGISRNALEEITANIGGRLPFGIVEPISFSIGYAHRTETGSFEGNDVINNGLFLLAATPTTPPPWPSAFPDAPKRGFNTDEVYGEAVIPLIDEELGLPAIRRLEFEGAIRYVDHSTAGGDITWSAGGRLEPRIGGIVDGLTIRGVFTRSIRAPNIIELFLNPTPVLRNALDVCAPARIDAGPNPTVRRANCTTALAEFGLTPATFNPTTSTRSPEGQLLGNPDLDNEKANSWSVGFVWMPPAIPRLRINVDYSEIKVTGAITRFTLLTAQSSCYDSPNFPNEPFCADFDRLDAAELAAQFAATGVQRNLGDIANGYRETYFNTQELDFAGIIGEVDYRIPITNFVSSDGEPGAIRLNVKAFHIRRFRNQTSSVSPIIESAGTLGTPQWRINGRIGFALDPVDFDVNVIWTEGTVLDLNATTEDIAADILNVPSYTLVNTSLGFRLGENYFLQFSVRNLFDRDVPFPGVVQRAFGIFDPIGRTYTATATMRF